MGNILNEFWIMMTTTTGFSQITGGALRTLGIPPDAPIQVAEAGAGKGKL